MSEAGAASDGAEAATSGGEAAPVAVGPPALAPAAAAPPTEQQHDGNAVQAASAVSAGDSQQLQPQQRLHYSLRAGTTLSSCGSEVLCLRYSPDGKFLVAGCGSGALRVYTTQTGALLTPTEVHQDSVPTPATWTTGSTAADGVGSNEQVGGLPSRPSIRPRLVTRGSTLRDVTEMSLPCTSMAFRPDGDGVLTANVLVAGFADGTVQHWHAPSGKCLSKLSVADAGPSASTASTASGLGVEVLSVAYAHTGEVFSAGASDGKIRLFSEETRELLVTLQPGVGFGAQQSGGHSGRVFSQKFYGDDMNMLVSAGWDNCVHVWDIRQARSVMTIFGPHVCGDACDMSGHILVTGSCRNTEQLQLWDLRTGKVLDQISWGSPTAGGVTDAACRLYAASFSHTQGAEGRFIAAGGGDGANECRVYQLSNGHLVADSLVGSILGLSSGVMSLAFAPNGKNLAFGVGNGSIHVVDMVVSTAQTTHDKILMF